MKNVVFALMIIMVTSSCSLIGARGPLFQDLPEKSGYSKVYIYMPNTIYRHFHAANVYINGHEIVTLYDRGYTGIYLKPGKYKITNESFLMEIDPLEFEVKTEPAYYIRLSAMHEHQTNVVYAAQVPTVTEHGVPIYQRWELMNPGRGKSHTRGMHLIEPNLMELP